jgi:uncharacterized protein YecE (DUF72 family)
VDSAARPSGIRIGTCSWNYDSWVGLVYTRTQKRAAAYLPEYAEHFDTAEIDSWFYAIPDREAVLEYASSVPSSFRWTCKAPQQITLTHRRNGKRGEPLLVNPDFLSVGLFAEFLTAIEPLLPAIDVVMLEFEYLNKVKMPGGVSQFMEKLAAFLDHVPGTVPIAIEPRNNQYLTSEWFSFLAERGVAHVFSQKQYMPNIWDVYRQYATVVRRMPRAVFRLLGGDRGEMEAATGRKWDRIVQPRDREKEIIAGVIADYIQDAYAILNINNHYEGSAPVSIRSIREYFGHLWEGARPPEPG